MKILICEDDLVMLRTLEIQFSKDGYTVLKASNGKDAEQLLNRNTDIDLMITDLYMPMINGLELITYVRKTLNNKSMCILMLTCVNVDDTISHAFELGVNDYWTKPLKLEEISDKLKLLLAHD